MGESAEDNALEGLSVGKKPLRVERITLIYVGKTISNLATESVFSATLRHWAPDVIKSSSFCRSLYTFLK